VKILFYVIIIEYILTLFQINENKLLLKYTLQGMSTSVFNNNDYITFNVLALTSII
jgi:hypothetical protein